MKSFADVCTFHTGSVTWCERLCPNQWVLHPLGPVSHGMRLAWRAWVKVCYVIACGAGCVSCCEWVIHKHVTSSLSTPRHTGFAPCNLAYFSGADVTRDASRVSRRTQRTQAGYATRCDANLINAVSRVVGSTAKTLPVRRCHRLPLKLSL